MSYRTTRDIVIPAGTEVGEAPVATRNHTPHVDAILPVTDDTTARWVMDLQDALDTGLVEEVPGR